MTSEIASARTTLLQEAGITGPAFCRAYTALVDAWLSELLGPVHDIALVAVGGYGRGDLCPGSDLDLLLLHGRRTPVGDLPDRLWYPVWDLGVGLDHSVRTPKEVAALADADLKTALGLVDARFVAGDRTLADPVIERSRQQWLETGKRLLPELAEAVDHRHRSFGEVAFLLEPDLKESKGGLRDVHALRAAALVAPVVPGPDAAARGSANWLLTVRIELQRQSGRSSDVLLLQEQDSVARALDEPDADRLMAKVANAARTIAWRSDDGWRRIGAWLSNRRRPADADVGLAADDRLDDPCVALRLAVRAARAGAAFDPDTLEELAADAAVPQIPWSATARQLLVDLLACGAAAIPVLEALDQKGILVRLLPEWGPVRSRPQRNAYHRFTVDRHLWEATANAAALVDRVDRPDLLLLGTLFHDIGKGYPGDHTVTGMEVVGRIGTRLGLDDADTGTLVSMVEHHLLLPDVATRRDLDDPATVEAVANAVGTPGLLRLLAALTEADSLATGPSAWSEWKAGLVADLAARTAAHLEGRTTETVLFPSPEQRALMAAGDVTVRLAGEELTVVAPDRPGLLSRVAGVLALHGIDVKAASIAGEDSMGVEVFTIDTGTGRAPDEAALTRDLVRAVHGRLALEARLAERARAYGSIHRPAAASPAQSSVSFDDAASAVATVIEVRAPDAIGVLYRITRALADCDLDVRSAKVTTLGHEVLDAFYVRDADGGKVDDPEYRREIERAVLAELAR